MSASDGGSADDRDEHAPAADTAVTAYGSLPPTDRAAVIALAQAAAAADGVYPLNDQVDLDLDADAQSDDAFRHLVAREVSADAVVGYAHVDVRSPDAASGHLVVRPDTRRRGVGRALAGAMSRVAAHGPLRVWAHGDLSPARAFADAAGWGRVRELRKMQLPLSTPIDEPHYPDGVSVRTFRPGEDEDAWVAVNAAAFAHHPEQGRLTADDLRKREALSWFDPAGFFLAERAGDLVGSHWTKVHPAADGVPAHGEVYVVGVRPDQQGSGLGKALTLTGVRHLRDQGLDVVLYVDGDNAAAVATYERIGFTVASVDVMYERAPDA
jgi:mycothiol synthase